MLRVDIDKRREEFSIVYGTSMSCPHTAGPFELGSDHVDPNHALDPGLVYNATADDYLTFLCSLGYTPNQIALFTKDGSVTDCSTRRRSVGDLN
ncbi:hypothetical protein E2562_032425 [Oryza meyeriana var. granulata]|uniref:Uncharacterized protein n=1 Tax=Oryza meyeriana var. granulata TaxID=110450 RepID=A0A6G1E5G0_9ORYZ|nr:hypothetical protein E2562_032425 [Oryza meyeriana var. granulata]